MYIADNCPNAKFEIQQGKNDRIVFWKSFLLIVISTASNIACFK